MHGTAEGCAGSSCECHGRDMLASVGYECFAGHSQQTQATRRNVCTGCGYDLVALSQIWVCPDNRIVCARYESAAVA